ncbi:hypothetical protein FIBSPDRAFT_722512, partial [Athelia psychrophila]
VRCSPQAKKYFRKCCADAKVKLLELLPYCKTRWGSWEGVIARLIIFKAVPNVDKGQPKYSSYRLSDDEWDLLRLIQIVLKIRNHSHDIILPAANSYYPTVWRVLPLFEGFIAKWRELSLLPEFRDLWPALEAGIESLEKYYNKTDASPVYIVSMCE